MLDKKYFYSLLLSISFLAILLVARMMYTKTFFFGFYVWNTFLAIVPIIFSSILIKYKLKKASTLIIFCLWFMFFPNAAYLVTDVLHFKERKDTPNWFDLIMVLQACWVGLLSTLVSLRQIELFLFQLLKAKQLLASMVLIIFTTSFGVYLGRFLRFNSWDIILNPILITKSVLKLIINPITHKNTWLFTLLFSCFIGIKYVFFNVYNNSHAKNTI